MTTLRKVAANSRPFHRRERRFLAALIIALAVTILAASEFKSWKESTRAREGAPCTICRV